MKICCRNTGCTRTILPTHIEMWKFRTFCQNTVTITHSWNIHWNPFGAASVWTTRVLWFHPWFHPWYFNSNILYAWFSEHILIQQSYFIIYWIFENLLSKHRCTRTILPAHIEMWKFITFCQNTVTITHSWNIHWNPFGAASVWTTRVQKYLHVSFFCYK